MPGLSGGQLLGGGQMVHHAGPLLRCGRNGPGARSGRRNSPCRRPAPAWRPAVSAAGRARNCTGSRPANCFWISAVKASAVNTVNFCVCSETRRPLASNDFDAARPPRAGDLDEVVVLRGRRHVAVLPSTRSKAHVPGGVDQEQRFGIGIGRIRDPQQHAVFALRLQFHVGLGVDWSNGVSISRPAQADGAEFEVGRLRGPQAAELQGQADRAPLFPVAPIQHRLAAAAFVAGEPCRRRDQRQRVLREVNSANRGSNDSFCRWICIPPGSFSRTSTRSKLAASALASAGQGFFGSLISTLAGGAGREGNNPPSQSS